jgi:general secretion pathway protein D
MSGGNCRTFYSFNRQAGVLTVSASRRQHDMVMRYIERVKASASAQVLIEAKIVETELDDRYQSGIEWSALNNKLGMVSRFTPIDSTNGLFTLSLPDRAIDGFSGDIDGPNGADLDDFIQLLEEFGTTRTLSSPRLHAINNQQAVLTFAENLVYFELNIQRERDNSAGVNQELFTVESEAKTVPIGIILTMQPSVDMKTGEITLMVRPTLSRVTSFVNDPAVSFLLAQGSDIGIQNQIPVVEVRELDSILKVQSGQVMVIGGLMERTGTNQENGVPGIAGVPWIGNLFKSVDRREQTRELVILIKATLIGSEGKVGEADQNIYNKFSGDSRPLQF